MQSFHYKFINRAIFTNSRLYEFKAVQSPLCTPCNQEEETYIHLFWECPLVQDLWCRIIKWCKYYIDDKFNYNAVHCLLLGSTDKKSLTNVFLVCKYYIYLQKHFHQTLSFKVLLHFIKNAMRKDFIAYNHLHYLKKSVVYVLWGHIPPSAFPD